MKVADITEQPVACSLSERELVERRAGILREPRRHREEVRWLPDGAAFRYAPGHEVVASLAECLRLESQCCAFLRFRLTIEPAGGPIWLELTGPVGTREFLAAQLGRANESPTGA